MIRFWFTGKISPFFSLSPDSDSNVIIGPSTSLLGEPNEREIPETEPKASLSKPSFIPVSYTHLTLPTILLV